MVAVNYDWDELEDNIDEEYDDAGIAVAEYTTDQSSYFHYDGLGSTFALTNGGAAVIDTYAFTATGEATFVAGGTVNPYRYLGRVGYLFDAVSEAVSVRRRTLLSGTARWLAVDPNPLRAYSEYV